MRNHNTGVVMRLVFVLSVLALGVVACGDDDNGGSAAQMSTSNGTGGTTAGETTDGTTGGGTTAATTGGGTTAATTGGGTTAATGGQSELCDEGAVIILAPEEGAVLVPDDDTEPALDGVQIEVRVSTDLVGEVILTVENEELGFSSGVLADGAESVVSGVPLLNGANTLTAFADAGGCYVTQSIQVTLDGGSSCVANSECPSGELCEEGGFCLACDSECSSDADCEVGRCVQGCVCMPTYDRVLIEDVSAASSGNTPGADIDAIGLRKPGQDERYVSRVWDSNFQGDENMFNDPEQLMGEPDAMCMPERFVSLGGQGGFVVVGFGDAFIEAGDSIAVYELGPTLCPEQTGWADENYEVSVGVSNAEDLFVEIGAGGPGQNVILVPLTP